MPEPHPRTDLQQPVGLSGLRGRGRDPEPPGRPPHQHRVLGRLGRHDQQQRPRIGGQRLDPAPEALLDPRLDRNRPDQPEPARQLCRAQPARQLQQGKRVARRLGQDPVPDLLIEPEADHRAQQRTGVLVRQTPHLQVRQSCELLTRLPRGEDQSDRLSQQAPRRERQHLRRCRMQPLCVIDHAQQWPILGHLRQQRQHRQPDQEPVRRASRPQPERDSQRVALRTRQAL
jgi:hypothetical protein